MYMIKKKEKPVRTAVERFDRFYMDLFGVYFYNGTLCIETLQKNLEETVADMPVFSSVLKKIDEDVFLEHVKPCNIKITVKHDVDERLFDLYSPNNDGILSSEEGIELHNICEHIETKPNVMEPVLDKPIMKITLLITKVSKRSILAVSVNHCLADAHTLIYFMKKWSLGEKFDEISEFSIDRDHLKPRNEEDMKFDPKILSRLRGYHNRDYCIPEKEKGFRFIFGKPFVRKVIHFSKSRLVDLKKLVKNDGKKFSSHDCVSAQLWRLYAALTILRFDNPATITPFALVVNARNRVSQVSKNYIGNASVLQYLELPRNELLEKLEFGDIVLKIRELINSFDDETFKSVIDLINLNSKRENFSKLTELIVDDWRVFDLQKPSNFASEDENLVCERVVVCPPSASIGANSMFFVNIAKEDGGMLVRCVFDEEEYELLKGLDLSSIESIDKLCQRIAEKKKSIINTDKKNDQ